VNYIGTTLHLYYIYASVSYVNVVLNLPPLRGSGDDGIRRELFICLLWRRIRATDNGSIFIGRDFSGVKLS